MATLIQRLYPITHYCSFNRGQGAGTHTAAGTWTYTASASCATSVEDLYGALDEKDYGAAVSMGGTGYVNNGQFEWTFGDAPVNITITNLTLVAYLRTSSGNNVAIDSAPTVEFFVDPAVGTRYYAGATDTVDAPCNRNTQAASGTFLRVTRSWASNPDSLSAWTRSDLVSGSFKAGIASDGTHGSGIDKTTGGSSASFDVAAFWVELETTPSGLYIEPVRTVLSHQLRLLSRPTRTVTIDVPPEFEDVKPGETIWASHTLLPWNPGYKDWEQVPLYVLSVADALDPPRLTLTCLDLREVYASFYSPFQVLGIDTQNTGLALFHQGGSWSTTRNQVAYGERPGDGLYDQVAANSPLLTDSGLLIQGGSDVNYLLNSIFSAGSSNTFTAWTKTTTGSATIIQDTADYLVVTAGAQRSAFLTTTTSSESCYLSQTVNDFAASTKLFVRSWYKNDSGSDAFFIQVQRNSDSYYWGPSTWGASVYDLRPDKSTTLARYTSGQIDTGASTENITVRMGHYATTATTANTGHIYSLELQKGTTFSWCRRDLLPTSTGGSVTRTADETSLDNSSDFRVFSGSRGFFAFDFIPQWSHSDLADFQSIGLVQHAVNGTGSPAGHLCTYMREDSLTGGWYWQAAVLATSGATLPAAGTTYRIACRMTSVASDEQGLQGQAFDIWVDGVKGTGTVGASELTPTRAQISIGMVTIEGPPNVDYQADGVIKNFVMDSWCPTDEQMARM